MCVTRHNHMIRRAKFKIVLTKEKPLKTKTPFKLKRCESEKGGR